MAATPSVDDSFTFVGGLYTEGSYFLTPKNSWKEGDNVIPSTDGSIKRRRALDFEDNYQPDNVTSEYSNFAFTTETWSSVAGDGTLEFLVVQRGPILTFYTSANGTLSAGLLPFTVDLEDFRCFGNTAVIGNDPITATSCYGKLLVTSKNTDPFIVRYKKSDNTIRTRKLELNIRDFTGIRSPTDVTAKKTKAQWQAINFWPHALYNLYNQGWKDDKIDAYVAVKGVYPSNTEQWIYGKNVDDNFDTTVLDKQDFGTSQAPRGRAILKAFYQDRASALDTLEDTTAQTPSVPSIPNSNDEYYYREDTGP